MISNVTEAVMEEVKTWQNRPLDAVYPIVYLDALVVKMREAGHVRNKAIYVAIGVNMEGTKRCWGCGRAGHNGEGAKFWLQVLTELKNRGVNDIFIVCVDGLKGFPEAIETVFPRSAGAVVYRASGAGSAELRLLETAQRGGCGSEADLSSQHGGQDAEQRLDEFAAKWDGAYPTISQMWRRNWEHLTPFFAYPADIRKVIYTTNAWSL